MSHLDPHSRATDAVHEHRPVEAQYVRQGRGGVRILTVLILSGGAAAVLLLGMWLVSNGGFAAQNIHDGDQIGDARAFSTEAGSDPDLPATGQAAGTRGQ